MGLCIQQVLYTLSSSTKSLFRWTGLYGKMSWNESIKVSFIHCFIFQSSALNGVQKFTRNVRQEKRWTHRALLYDHTKGQLTLARGFSMWNGSESSSAQWKIVVRSRVDESSESDDWSRVCHPLWLGPGHVKCSVGKYRPPKEMLRGPQLIKRPAFAASLVRSHSVEQLLSCNVHKTHEQRGSRDLNSTLIELCPSAWLNADFTFHLTEGLTWKNAFSWAAEINAPPFWTSFS